MNIQLIATPPPALQQLVRRADTHKGLYGSVAIIGGATNMVGAALLAGRAALNLGSGKIYLGLLSSELPIDFIQPELMICKPKPLLNNKALSHILIGPGLGQTHKAKRFISECLSSTMPLIIDADGLNLIAHSKKLQLLLQKRHAETLITPHPAEAARLLNCQTAAIQSNRHEAIIKLQQKFNCSIVLKGYQTLIHGHDLVIFQNQTGNSALSSAGQGDVLGGIILALWTQGLSAIDAGCCGVFIHGQAADVWRDTYPNGIGLTASETIAFSKSTLNSYLKSLDN